MAKSRIKKLEAIELIEKPVTAAKSAKIKFEYENKAKRIEDTKSNLALLMSDDVEMSDSESERENEEQNNNNSDENESNGLSVDSDN